MHAPSKLSFGFNLNGPIGRIDFQHFRIAFHPRAKIVRNLGYLRTAITGTYAVGLENLLAGLFLGGIDFRAFFVSRRPPSHERFQLNRGPSVGRKRGILEKMDRGAPGWRIPPLREPSRGCEMPVDDGLQTYNERPYGILAGGLKHGRVGRSEERRVRKEGRSR